MASEDCVGGTTTQVASGCANLPCENSRDQSREDGALSSAKSILVSAACSTADFTIILIHCFSGMLYTREGDDQTLVMKQELNTLLCKVAVECVPPHSRYFIVPEKDGGLRPV